jgi:surfeit locus 1 family protein
VRRFPLGITVAAAVGLAILLGLGVWQLHRLAWKQDLLARIAALTHAPPRPLPAVLASAARGVDVGFVRVSVRCAPQPPPAQVVYRYALHNRRVGWRLMSFCPTPAGPWTGVVLDRGLVEGFAGQMQPSAKVFPIPHSVSGILRAPGAHSFLSVPARASAGEITLVSLDASSLRLIAGPGQRPAPWYLALETETPPTPGLSPAPLPQDIPNNHFVYALTWFGLAGVLLWMWAAFVWRKVRAP